MPQAPFLPQKTGKLSFSAVLKFKRIGSNRATCSPVSLQSCGSLPGSTDDGSSVLKTKEKVAPALKTLLDFQDEAHDGCVAGDDHLVRQAGGDVCYVARAQFLAGAVLNDGASNFTGSN